MTDGEILILMVVIPAALYIIGLDGLIIFARWIRQNPLMALQIPLWFLTILLPQRYALVGLGVVVVVGVVGIIVSYRRSKS